MVRSNLPIPDLLALESYDYPLPEEKIAHHPIEPRDQSRLLHVSDSLQHRHFYELPEILDPERDLLVLNETQVIPARYLGFRSGENGPQGKIEVLLLRNIEGQIWECIVKSSAKQKPGLAFEFPDETGKTLLRAKIIPDQIDRTGLDSGAVWVEFDRDPISSGVGELPLPPYLDRPEGPTEEDQASYQTIFARVPGSAAAPTASLHFTSGLLNKMEARGFSFAKVLLHVGLGTFRPVRSARITDHSMHEEYYEVPSATGEKIRAHLRAGKRVVAVGTTVLRALESWAQTGYESGWKKTTLFLHPANAEFKVVSALLTNFHQPQSSLLMLVSAFGGYQRMRQVYDAALKNNYRFLSYGDAQLIERKESINEVEK